MTEGDPRFQFRILPEGVWREIAPGARRKDIAEDVYLLRLAAGASENEPVTDKVAHRFVIEGELRVGRRHLRAGDNHRAPAGSVAEAPSSDGGCLVLIVLTCS
jgi:hypothetical protein